MASARWQQVQQVFCAAIECSDADRAALFARECGEDAGLRREVESLLAAHERSGLVDQLASKTHGARDVARAAARNSTGREDLSRSIQ